MRPGWPEMLSRVLVSVTRAVDVTGLLCIWGELGPTVIRWQRSRRPFVTARNIGSVLPVVGSATGHVFLSYLPRELTAPQVDRELRRRDPASGALPRSRADVSELVEQTRARGYASVDGRLIPGLRAISAPVLDMQGHASAAITLIDPEPALVRTDHPALKALLGACSELSRENGYDARRSSAD